MLDKSLVDFIKKTIKEINKEKDLTVRVEKMIEAKEDLRNRFNEELDDLFAEIEIKPKRYKLNEQYYSHE